MTNLNFRKLTADELEARVATVTPKGCSVLIYKNARVDMAVLDETVGQMNWQRQHREEKGNLFCGIGIRDEATGEWVWKWDCGTESYTEKEKGEASDSFKRAGFNWGIGRELYTCPFIWFRAGDVNLEERNGKTTTRDHFEVKTIEYDGNRVSFLEVENTKTKKLFSWGMPAEATAQLSPLDRKRAELKKMLMTTNSDMTLFLTWCGREFKHPVGAVDELNENECDRAIAKVRQKESK